MKREILELRRAVMPLAVPLRRLAEGYTPLVPEQVRSYFRDVDDHLTTVSDRVASFDELLTTLVDATLAKISLQQNTDMRKITAWAAIIAVPTMGVGVYGMNFDYMPELHWRFGYPLIMCVIVGVCLILYRIFRRRTDGCSWTTGRSTPSPSDLPSWSTVRRVEGGSPMPRLFNNPRFWMMTFVVTWLAVITVLIAMGSDIAPDTAGAR